ncbi:hypothetical protein ALC57_17948 [Trachymyrmex cornetzi]|uniref:Uncharacterized protein n=1 Tax=Trachymyrmex cornetzi TaxID=471704 RepID=A0A195DAL2_9HYME|nr:hypothetical protein ALC57_17948 [Trachymyrmex cornetzi]
MKVDLQPLSSFLGDLVLRTPGTTEVLRFQSITINSRDGIKSSEARGGWRGELKFSIASTAPPILHSPVLTGT